MAVTRKDSWRSEKNSSEGSLLLGLLLLVDGQGQLFVSPLSRLQSTTSHIVVDHIPFSARATVWAVKAWRLWRSGTRGRCWGPTGNSATEARNVGVARSRTTTRLAPPSPHRLRALSDSGPARTCRRSCHTSPPPIPRHCPPGRRSHRGSVRPPDSRRWQARRSLSTRSTC